MKKIAAALLLSATISAPAVAASQGGYVLVEPGFAGLGKPMSQLGTATFLSPVSITLGGGYRFSQLIGVEAGYLASGDSTIKSTGGSAEATEKLKASALQVALVGTFPIGSKFDVIAKLGAANTKVDYTATITGGSFAPTVVTSASGSKTNLMYGLGGQYNINPHFAVRVHYQDFGKVKLGVGANDWTTPGASQDIGVKAFSVGMLYSF